MEGEEAGRRERAKDEGDGRGEYREEEIIKEGRA